MIFSFVIVNYNTEDYIQALLEDICQQDMTKSQFEVILVNNIQNDVLRSMVQARNFATCLSLKIIESPYNIGFGRAMNLGATQAQGEHLLITNPDIRISSPIFLTKLYASLCQKPDYGLATCQILDNHGKDNAEFYSYEFGETLGYSGQVCWYYGCFLTIRKSVFEQLNGFDKDFFMYCEDVDLAYRIKKLGLELYKINDLEVNHVGGASEPIKGYDFYHRVYRSRFLFAHKHYSPQKFSEITQAQTKKANAVLFKYGILGKLNLLNGRRRNKIFRYQAVQDITQKIANQGTDSLYFK